MDQECFELSTGSHLTLWREWIDPKQGDALFAELRDGLPWRQETIRIAGKRVLQPRLTAWMGDSEAVYTYSGLRNEPLPWSPEVQMLRHRTESWLGAVFNSVLLNYYRNGTDSMGMHADNEPELGQNPLIASLSLGADRLFVLVHRRDRSQRVELTLPHGSLLLMAGTTQQHHKHGLPKQPGAGPRINLTFRLVHPNSSAREPGGT